MAKKKGKIGGVALPDFHFNNPALQHAYDSWFAKGSLKAPVVVQYYDPTTVGGVPGGTVKRTPLTPGIQLDPYEIERGKEMEKYKYGWNSGPGAIFKQHPIVKVKKSSGNTAAQSGALGGSPGRGGSADLMSGVQRTNARLKALGAKPVKQGGHNSIWNRTLDVLSRGNYAVAEGVRQAVNDANHHDASIGSQLGAFGHGFVQGAEGKKKTTFGKVLDEQGFGANVEAGLNRISGGKGAGFGKKYAHFGGAAAQAALGLGLDIGADPTTYVGLGLVGKGGRAAKLSEEAAAHLDVGAKIANRGKKVIKTFDSEQRDLLAGKRYVSGQMRHSEESLIHEPLRNMHGRIKNTRYTEIKAALQASGEAPGKALNKMARDQASKEADEWLATAIKNYQDIVQTGISKGLGIGRTGVNGRKVTIVPAPVIDFAKTKITSIDSVQRGLDAANKYLRASAGVAPELHNLRLGATNSGMTKAEFMGNRLRTAFSGMHPDMREHAWSLALDGKTQSGELIKIDGKTADAAESLNNDLAHLDNAIHGGDTGNPPMSSRELHAYMPPGTKFKFQNTKGVADIRKSMKAWDEKDGPKALWMGQQAYERANAVRSMYVSAADAFGIRTTGPGAMKNISGLLDGLKNRGWREVSEHKTHGLLKGVMFDEETAKGIEKIIDMIGSERNWGTFTRKLARITSPIKFWLTVPNPGYHIRNAIGDAFINELDNTSIKSYEQAASTLRHTGEKYGGDKPLIMSEGNMLEEAYKRPSQTILFHTKTALRKPNGTKNTAITQAEIYAGMHQFGITQNFTLSEFSNIGNNPGALSHFGGKLKTKVTSASEMRENYFRLAHFIELVKRNPTGARTLEDNMAAAAARIRKTHFDYTDFTKFEKQVASNVIPFYKWTRKAIPLMLEILFTNPGKAIVPSKIQNNISMMLGNKDPLGQDPIPDLAGMVPKWMLDSGYVPGGLLGGEHSMFGISSPFTDTYTQTLQPGAEAIGSGSPKQMFNFLMQQANPAIKAPFELTQNENVFLSQNGQDVPVYRKGTVKKDLLNYVINQIPYAHQISRASTGGSDKQNLGSLVSQLTGVYTQEVTPTMQRGELYRQQGVATPRLTDAKKHISDILTAKGVPPPTTNSEWEALFTALSKQAGGNYQTPKRKSSFKTVLQ